MHIEQRTGRYTLGRFVDNLPVSPMMLADISCAMYCDPMCETALMPDALLDALKRGDTIYAGDYKYRLIYTSQEDTMPEQPQTDTDFPNVPKRELPRYKCHKEVHALKIVRVIPSPQQPGDPMEGMFLVPELGTYGRIFVDDEWVRTRQPEAPGYYVVYEDGYSSWSPVGPFEKGYTLIE